MATAVAQQSGAAGGFQQQAAPRTPIAISYDGIKLYPKFSYPQPVPYQRLPTAAGVLPSWEQKKLELDAADLSAKERQPVNGHVAEPVLEGTKETEPPLVSAQPAPISASSTHLPNGHEAPAVKPRAGSYSKLQKGSNAAVTKPTFLANIRSSSSRSSTVRHVRDASYASKTGGIGYNPSDSISSSTGSSGAGQSNYRLPKNPFLRFITKNFSAKYAAEQERIKSAQRSQQPPVGVQIAKVPQSYQSGKKGERGIGNTLNADDGNSRKTRSTGFAQKMKEASGKVTTKLQETFTRFNSKTPKEQLPQTWEEWRRAYARGDIDILDMPRPPARDTGADDPSPEEAGYLAAPLPENQKERQLAFNRLDIEGKRGPKASTIAVQDGEEALPDTLEGHPA